MADDLQHVDEGVSLSPYAKAREVLLELIETLERMAESFRASADDAESRETEKSGS